MPDERDGPPPDTTWIEVDAGQEPPTRGTPTKRLVGTVAVLAVVALLAALVVWDRGSENEVASDAPPRVGTASSSIVAVTEDHAIVEVDPASGEVVRTMVEPGSLGPIGGGDDPTTLSVAPDGTTLYLDRADDSVIGGWVVERLDLTTGETERVGVGRLPVVDSTGSYLAWATLGVNGNGSLHFMGLAPETTGELGATVVDLGAVAGPLTWRPDTTDLYVGLASVPRPDGAPGVGGMVQSHGDGGPPSLLWQADGDGDVPATFLGPDRLARVALDDRAVVVEQALESDDASPPPTATVPGVADTPATVPGTAPTTSVPTRDAPETVLFDLDDGRDIRQLAGSPDGASLVAVAQDDDGPDLLRWTEDDGVVPLTEGVVWAAWAPVLSSEPEPTTAPPTTPQEVTCSAAELAGQEFPPQEGLPAAVEETRQAVIEAAVACDWDALEGLVAEPTDGPSTRLRRLIDVEAEGDLDIAQLEEDRNSRSAVEVTPDWQAEAAGEPDLHRLVDALQRSYYCEPATGPLSGDAGCTWLQAVGDPAEPAHVVAARISREGAWLGFGEDPAYVNELQLAMSELLGFPLPSDHGPDEPYDDPGVVGPPARALTGWPADWPRAWPTRWLDEHESPAFSGPIYGPGPVMVQQWWLDSFTD